MKPELVEEMNILSPCTLERQYTTDKLMMFFYDPEWSTGFLMHLSPTEVQSFLKQYRQLFTILLEPPKIG